MSHSLLIDRWFARLPWSRNWSIALIAASLVVTPTLLAWLDGYGARTLFIDNRAQFLYVVMIVYLLLLAPHVLHSREAVADALRPTVDLDDAAYGELTARASAVRPLHEAIAFCIGMAIGWVVNVVFEPLPEPPSRFDVYAYLSRLLLFGVNAWALFILFSVPRLTRALLRRVAHVDVFDVSPFEPIGRQSLLLALVLVGFALLGLLSVSLQDRFLWRQYLITYSVVLVALVLLFLTNTYPAHRVLVAAKREQIAFVDRYLARAYLDLRQEVERWNVERSNVQRSNVQRPMEHATATEIQALAAVKVQLKAARTWPFDTEMVRSFFVAVFAPLFLGIARLIVDWLSQ